MKIKTASFYPNPNGTTTPIPDQGLFNSDARTEGRRALARCITDDLAIQLSASDAGHYFFGPNGALIHRLLQSFIQNIVRDHLGASQIITPCLFVSNARGVSEESAPFLKQMYMCGSENDPAFLLRPSGDYGAFSYISEILKKPEDLPLRVFEIGPAWRRIQRSSLTGIHSGRTFTMVDYHAFALDQDSLFDEWHQLMDIQEKAISWLCPGNIVVLLEIENDFFERNRTNIASFAAKTKSKVAVSILNGRRNYWTLQHRFFRSDGLGLMDGQIDFINADRYGITAIDTNGESHAPGICHGFWGTVERWIAIYLSEGIAELPFWLRPVQLRLLPCSVAGEQMTEKLVRSYRHSVRIDSDSSDSLGMRIKRAFKEGCPAISVVGDREAATNPDALIIRAASGSEYIGLDHWLAVMRENQHCFPFEPLPIRSQDNNQP
jgi:threonyl-tRNA synthetase